MLLIYLPVITPRCEYIFHLIFKEQWGIPYQLTNDPEAFKAYQKEKLNYSFTRYKDEFYIHASSLLFEQVIQKINVSVQKKGETTILFSNDQSCDLGFDVFSAVFYMISRYEEYLPFVADRYGRFKATDSFACNNGFLQQPVADIWISMLGKRLKEKFPCLPFACSSFNHIITYDIDIAYAFKGRGLLRHIASTGKDLTHLNFKNIISRIWSLCNFQKDPWDVYDALFKKITKGKINSVFFFLLADYSRYDKNISFRHPLMKRLVAKMATFSAIGIHPSFASAAMPKKILVEKERLEIISGKKINRSRQHFLKFTLPATYQYLIKAGINEDYSMGFADMPGFRAGTCKPFYFYDLQKEHSTGLKVFPITVMEGSFISYLKITPAKALEQIIKLIEEVKNENGTFISIWHNHTLSETGIYKGWRSVHDTMLEYVLSRG